MDQFAKFKHANISNFTVYVCVLLNMVYSYYCYLQAFIGNIDRDRYSINSLIDSPLSKTFRIYPLTWNESPAMRMELYGCGDSGN